jgi:hypothetical protein
LVRALATRLRVIYESAQSDVEVWNKSAAAQLDAQLRERRRKFTHRMEAVERIQEAADSLDERLADVEQQTTQLNDIDSKLLELTNGLMALPQDSSQEPQAKAQNSAAVA